MKEPRIEYNGYITGNAFVPTTPTINHCATCGHYREWHSCLAGDVSKPVKAANVACELYTTDRASDLIDDGYGIRARGGLVYFG